MLEQILPILQLIVLALTLVVTVFLSHRTARLNQKMLTLRAAEDFAVRDKANQAALEKILGAPIFLQERIDPEDIRFLEKNREHRICLLSYLNHYETLARGVNMGIYDEQVFRLAREGLIVKEYELWSEYINDYRDRNGRPQAWNQFEALVERWSAS